MHCTASTWPDMVHLSPSYNPAVKRLPVTTRTSKCWFLGADEALRCCFETTDVLCDSDGDDIDSLAECINVNFCHDDILPSREIGRFSNNKPWVTNNLKALPNMKKKASKEGDRDKVKDLQRQLRVKIREGKEAFTYKLE